MLKLYLEILFYNILLVLILIIRYSIKIITIKGIAYNAENWAIIPNR